MVIREAASHQTSVDPSPRLSSGQEFLDSSSASAAECRVLGFSRPASVLGAVLIERLFPDFPLFFPLRTGKTGNIPNFGNLTED